MFELLLINDGKSFTVSILAFCTHCVASCVLCNSKSCMISGYLDIYIIADNPFILRITELILA